MITIHKDPKSNAIILKDSNVKKNNVISKKLKQVEKELLKVKRELNYRNQKIQ